MNQLYYGDNLEVLRRHIGDESVDLIYLDPPFNSRASYNVLFAERDGTRAASQIKAFEDTWKWDETAARACAEVIEAGGKVSEAMQAFRTFLGDSDMMAYLAMMAPRLVELRRVLKPTGSLYLHCDPTASHYLKLLLDAVFGPPNFCNEIIWKRTTAHSSARRYAPIHDVILYYRRSARARWTAPREQYDEQYLDRYYKYDDGDGRLYWRADITGPGVRHGETGRPWRGHDVTAKGRHWAYPMVELEELDRAGRVYWPPKGGMPQEKRYREGLKGRAATDLWLDVNRINPVGNERLGYPTQKPEALLERIIAASSHDGDTVLDAFCGCGTAVVSAQRLGRRWIGIDITSLAISLVRNRLLDAFGHEAKYEVIGEPVSVPDAAKLARDDPYQFQWWALGLVGARPAEARKGADKGVDGRIYFFEGLGDRPRQIILSVKAGHVTASQVRDLRGVIEREHAAIGVLLCMEDPTQPMRKEAANAGFYEGFHQPHEPPIRYARLQLLTIEDLLTGKTIHRPPSNVSFKRAPKAKIEVRERQPTMWGEDEPDEVE